MGTTVRITADTLRDNPYALSDVMEFDHVVTVHADGTVTDGPSGLYAPDLTDPDPYDTHPEPGWELLNGYSGQYGYSGPHLHDSEQLAGGIARDILAEPGHYVAVICQYTTDEDGEPLEETYLEGWAVARYVGDDYPLT